MPDDIGAALRDATPPRDDTLEVHGDNLPATVKQLRDILAATGALYNRENLLVRLIRDANGRMCSHPLTFHSVVMIAHDHCQPKRCKPNGTWVPITLPDAVAKKYLDLQEWRVPPLAGVTTCPLIRADGSIIYSDGYDAGTQTYVDGPPALIVPDRPTRDDAAQALLTLRATFCTFPFADAQLIRGDDGIDRINIDKPPATHESLFLAALLTAAVRPSLQLAPGLLVNAPDINGSGAGKGLLVRAIAMVAFGYACSPITPGHDRAEFDKRLAGELMSGKPVVFLDNLNNFMLDSKTLASAQTERPSSLRPLGTSTIVSLNHAAWIALTGNGITLTLDLVRRNLPVKLDPRTEDPEARPFKPGFLRSIEARRVELLSAAFTILRWGRQQSAELKRGESIGSYEDWAEWVRDPLLALGCVDQVKPMREAKQDDPKRQELAELFDRWWFHHEDNPKRISELDDEVINLMDPHKRGRQWQAHHMQTMNGTRHAGYLLTMNKGGGKRSKATYQLTKTTTEAERPPHEAYEAHAHDHPTHKENGEYSAYGGNGIHHAEDAPHAGVSPVSNSTPANDDAGRGPFKGYRHKLRYRRSPNPD